MHELAESSAPPPSETETDTRPGQEKARTVALMLLATVGCAFLFYLGRDFFQPIAIALLLDAALSPLVRGMKRLRVPNVLGAAAVVLALMLALAALAFALSGPIEHFMAAA